ncbi:hypothetical protein MTR67_039640 [Solanum verrucosum]|uniref:Uncharacterized protein n=1 Tax=Solanum verrucosum TaxID=315347 RepID=A0AAF0UH84_SOLVR|nr:hypothetical protein MTR67_039640 [Solanum verrucosum]
MSDNGSDDSSHYMHEDQMGDAVPEDAKFEALYNEEVNYMGNQLGDSHPNYLRLGGNQGWNKDQDNGLRDLRDRGGNWRDREAEKDRYLPPYDRPKPKEPAGSEGK